MNPRMSRERGATLLEVLVAVLIMSFGMLALGGMLAYAVQLPKLSAYRATAMQLASAHVERMRANTKGFHDGAYPEPNTFRGSAPGSKPACAYPGCDSTQLAALDKWESNSAISSALPPDGGMRVVCTGTSEPGFPCHDYEGEMWVMWTEPPTFASISGSSSDECPGHDITPDFPNITGSAFRCLHIKFKL